MISAYVPFCAHAIQQPALGGLKSCSKVVMSPTLLPRTYSSTTVCLNPIPINPSPIVGIYEYYKGLRRRRGRQPVADSG